jgi:hypothetical protein
MTYLEPSKEGRLLWTKQEPMTIRYQLMVRQEKCLAAFFVWSVIVWIFFVVHLSLIILRDQPIHDADVPGPCPGKLLSLFVEIILIPAKIVTIITQGSVLPHVRSPQQQAADFSNALPIMAEHLKLMVSGINTAKDCPQKFLSRDKAQCSAIILSDLRQ